MAASPTTEMLERLRDEVVHRLPDFLRDLESIVNIESGSYAKAGVDEVAAWMTARLTGLGATIERHAHETLGDTVVATLRRDRSGPAGPLSPRILLIGHADTVFEPGYLARRPFEIDGDRILGPGVSDMKSGLLVGLYALEALRAVGVDDDWLPVGELVYVVNPDEEIGSPVSTPIITELARTAEAAFVMEAARENGDIVSARKGMMHLRATIHGRSAHAGVEPERGRSATLEAAHKTVALHALNGRWPGVTVNVGEIRGGTRPNIVAEECVITLDMRARQRAEQDEAEAAIREILESSTVPDVTTEVVQLAHSRPMEKTAYSAKLVDAAGQIAARLGFELRDAETGGGSDANTTAGTGVPTLDGLGPVGGNDHSPFEYVEKSSIVPRTTLLAALLLSVGG
ncbi:MAG: M20 family metallopeptidase [Chloroflexota bacterium]|jgi:glutamate carboxypeptidase